MSNAFDDLPAGNAFDDLAQPATAKDRIEAHQAGVWKGVSYVLGAIPDVVPNLYNLGKADLGMHYSALTGEAPPKALEAGDPSPVSAWIAKKLNEVKVPKGVPWDSEDRRLFPTEVDRPDDPASRYIAAASGVLPAVASGGSLPNAVKGLVPAVAGASAVQYVSDAKPFKNETANTSASVIANVLADALTRAAGRGISGIAQPFTAGGQRTIVGRALTGAATDPDTAIQNLSNVPEHIPGSSPTSGVASKDPGLVSLESGLKNEAENKPLFNDVLRRNNAARQAALSGAAGSETDLATAIANRSSAVKGPYESARVVSVPVDAELTDLLSKPSMQNALGRAKKLAAEAGEPLIEGRDIPEHEVSSPLLDSSGKPFTSTVPAQSASISGRALQYIKMSLSDSLDSGPQQGMGAHELRAIRGTMNSLNDWTSRNVPELRAADTLYRTASGPINQMQILQELQKRSANTAPDLQGTDILNQGKWSRAVDKAQAEGDLAKLSPQQQSLVRAMTADLDREASAGSAVERTAGSNTAFNLSSHQLLGKLLGQKVGDSAIGKTVGRVIDWAYHAPDEQMREILAHSMLRPDQARQLMLRAQQNKPMDMQTVMAQRALQNLVNVP